MTPVIPEKNGPRPSRIVGNLESAAYIGLIFLLFGGIAHVFLTALWIGLSALLERKEPPFFLLLDRVFLILILLEILHTVTASLQTRRLLVEPFLIAGIIALIRRMMAISIEQVNVLQENLERFYALLWEFGVVAVAVALLSGALWVLRRSVRS